MFRGVRASGKQFLAQYPRNAFWWHPLSALTLGLVGNVSKLFISVLHKYQVHNRDLLFRAQEESKRQKRGLITVMNHVSILDDPLAWGILPSAQLFSPHQMRWTMGAEDICFKNKFESYFFSLGQVLSTRRFGAGPFQPSIDAAICLLDQGEWVHVFPEGFVHQPEEPHELTMKYFKWGVSRLILETEKPPIVVPMYSHGLQHVFPEHMVKRALGYKSVADLQFSIGDALDEQVLELYVQRWKALADGRDTNGYVPEDLQTGEDARALRIEMSRYIRGSVSALRQKQGLDDETISDMHDANFWRDNKVLQIVKTKGLSILEKAKKAEKVGNSQDTH